MSREQLNRLLEIWPYLSKSQRRRLANLARMKCMQLRFPVLFAVCQAVGVFVLLCVLRLEHPMMIVVVYGGSLALVLSGVMVRRMVRGVLVGR